MRPFFIVSVGHYLSFTGKSHLNCGSAEHRDGVFSSSLWVVLSGFRKTSVVKRSSIPLSSEATIITPEPVNRRSSTSWVEMFGGLGGWWMWWRFFSHLHLKWKNWPGKGDRERQITTLFFCIKRIHLDNAAAVMSVKQIWPQSNCQRPKRNECAYELFFNLKLNGVQGNVH